MADSFSLQKYHTLVRLNPNDPEAHFGLAMALEEKGDIAEAGKEYDTAQKLSNNTHARAFLHMGFLLARQDERALAVREWQKAWEIDPNVGMVMKDPNTATFYHKKIQTSIEAFNRPLSVNQNDGYAHFHLGMAYKFFDKPELALSSLKRAMDINPRLWEAYAAAGQIYAMLGQNSYAILHFSKAADANPKFADAHFNLGIIYDRENMVAKAIYHLERALELDNTNARIYHALGNIFMKAQQVMKAIKMFQKSVDLDPKSAEVHFAMARACEAIFRPDFAIQEYERAIEIDPRYSEARYNLGMIALQVGDVPRAIESLEQCLKISPADAYAHYNLAEAYRRVGNYDMAIPHYYSSIELNPKDAFALYNLALAYAKTQQYELAVPQYRKAIALAPREGHFHYDLARALQAVGNHKEAVVEFEAAIESNPNDTGTLFELARSYMESGQFDACIKLYQRLIQLNPNSADAHHQLGIAFMRLEEHDYAFEEFQRAIKIDGTHERSLYLLGTIYVRHRGRPELGVDLLKQALAVNPQFTDARLELSEALSRMGREEEAREQLDAVRAAVPEDVPLRIRFARQLAALGRGDEALAELNLINTMDTENVEARSTLAGLYETRGQAALAIDQLRHIISLRPQDVATLLHAAALCVRIRHFEDAKTFYSRVLQIDPDHPVATTELEALFAPSQQQTPAPAKSLTFGAPTAETPSSPPADVVEKVKASPPAVETPASPPPAVEAVTKPSADEPAAAASSVPAEPPAAASTRSAPSPSQPKPAEVTPSRPASPFVPPIRSFGAPPTSETSSFAPPTPEAAPAASASAPESAVPPVPPEPAPRPAASPIEAVATPAPPPVVARAVSEDEEFSLEDIALPIPPMPVDVHPELSDLAARQRDAQTPPERVAPDKPSSESTVDMLERLVEATRSQPPSAPDRAAQPGPPESAPPPAAAAAAASQAADSPPAPTPPPAVTPTPPVMTPAQADAAFRRAVLSHAMGRKEEAAKLFERILESVPDFYQAYFYLGKDAIAKNDTFTAKYLFETGSQLAVTARDAEFVRMFGEELVLLGGTASTIPPLSETAAKAPEAPPAPVSPPAPVADSPRREQPAASVARENAAPASSADELQDQRTFEDSYGGYSAEAEKEHYSAGENSTYDSDSTESKFGWYSSSAANETTGGAGDHNTRGIDFNLPEMEKPLQEPEAPLPDELELLVESPVPEPELLVGADFLDEPEVPQVPEPLEELDLMAAMALTDEAEPPPPEPEPLLDEFPLEFMREEMPAPAPGVEALAPRPHAAAQRVEPPPPPVHEEPLYVGEPMSEEVLALPERVRGAVHESLTLANDFLDLKRYDKARPRLELVLELAPNLREAIMKLADLLRTMEHVDEAIALLEKGVTVHTRDLDMHDVLAEMYNQRGQRQQALEVYMRALDRHPENAVFKERLSRYGAPVSAVSNEHRETIPWLQRASKEDPGNVDIAVKLARAYAAADKQALAVVQYQKALKLQERTDIYLDLGRTYVRLGKTEAAFRAYLSASQMATMDENDYEELGTIVLPLLLAREDYERAFELARRLLTGSKLSAAARAQFQRHMSNARDHLSDVEVDYPSSTTVEIPPRSYAGSAAAESAPVEVIPLVAEEWMEDSVLPSPGRVDEPRNVVLEDEFILPEDRQPVEDIEDVESDEASPPARKSKRTEKNGKSAEKKPPTRATTRKKAR